MNKKDIYIWSSSVTFPHWDRNLQIRIPSGTVSKLGIGPNPLVYHQQSSSHQSAWSKLCSQQRQLYHWAEGLGDSAEVCIYRNLRSEYKKPMRLLFSYGQDGELESASTIANSIVCTDVASPRLEHSDIWDSWKRQLFLMHLGPEFASDRHCKTKEISAVTGNLPTTFYNLVCAYAHISSIAFPCSVPKLISEIRWRKVTGEERGRE